MKRFVILIMCMLAFGVDMLAAESKENKPEKIQQPMLWRVTGNGLKKPSWLFGTIHVGDSRITGGKTNKEITTSPQANAAFNNADDVVVELDTTDANLLLKVATLSRLPAGKTLDDVVSESTVKLVKEAIKSISDNATPETVDTAYKPLSRFKPVMLGISLQTLPIVKKMQTAALDMLITVKAKKNAKKLRPLETAKQQMDCFDIFDTKEQEEFLVACCKEVISGETQSEMDEMINAYLEGDIDQLNAIMSRQLERARKEAGKGFVDKFYDSILYGRNDGMVAKIKAFFKADPDRSFFIAVGYAHMTGETGLVEQLRKAGYTVERVEKPVPTKIENPMLWEITGKELEKPSWIFGAMQIGDPRITGGNKCDGITTSPQINDAFDKADEVIVWVDTSSDKVNKEAWALYYLPDGQTIEDVLSESTIELIWQALDTIIPKIDVYKDYPGYEDKIYASMIHYKPMLMMDSFVRLPLARYLRNSDSLHKVCLKAKKKGKKINGLETYKQRLARCDFLTKEEQEEYIVGTCKAMMDEKKPGARSENFINLYLRGDIPKIRKISDKYREEDKKYVRQAIRDKFENSFNELNKEFWLPNIKKILQAKPQKSLFFAINYGSVIDKDTGLLKQLREAGYTVTRVKAQLPEEEKPVDKKTAKAE